MPLLILQPSHSWFPSIETEQMTPIKLRIFRQQQMLSSESGAAEEMLWRQYPCYSNCKLYGKCVWNKKADMLFAEIGKTHYEIVFKTYCVWMKLACNRTDHRGRKSSVIPFNLSMAWKQGGHAEVCPCCLQTRPGKYCCCKVTVDWKLKSFFVKMSRLLWTMTKSRVKSTVEYSLRFALELIYLNDRNSETLKSSDRAMVPVWSLQWFEQWINL